MNESRPACSSMLYKGVVLHRRFGPKPHALRYRMVMALLDLDELDVLDAKLRLFSRNRLNLFAFHDRDHLPSEAQAASLKATIEERLAEAGIDLGGGAIRLLSLPRMLGYAFNPLSVYFCHAADGTLAAILYEVNNTFRQRHTYLIPVPPNGRTPIVQTCAKRFYVSPFLDMDMTYDFRVVPPGPQVAIAVDGWREGERVITASFAGKAQPMSDATLLRAFVGHPLLSFAVVAGIHWEALRLWLKGIRLRTRPPPPDRPVSLLPRREV